MSENPKLKAGVIRHQPLNAVFPSDNTCQQVYLRTLR